MISFYKNAFFFVLFIFTLLPGAVAAAVENGGEAADKPDRYVKIRLLPEYASVQPGEEIWIGIEQSIHPHWHTYWYNPGDSGARPAVTWDLPKGFEISEILWPTPKKLPYGPLMNYGYEDNVILLQKLKVPDDLPGGPVHLNADVDVLVCKDICIPEFGNYKMVLNAPDVQSENNSAYLAAARDKLPIKAPEPAEITRTGEGDIELHLPAYAWCEGAPGGCQKLAVFPYDWGLVDNTAKARSVIEDGTLVIRQKAGERDLAEMEDPRFLIAYEGRDGSRAGVEFIARRDGAQAVAALPGNGGADFGQGSPLLYYFLAALLGGVILNLMPCVFPVLSMKALSLVKFADKHPVAARMSGIFYTAGVVAGFLVIAGILIALQAGGAQIGWGFQLQNPVFVALIAYLLFLIGLNLMGFFEVGTSFGTLGAKLTEKEGLAGAFFTGVLATVVSTPCIAPFMGAAIGFALTQAPLVALLIFGALGLGLALPYLALSFVPVLQHLLPRPGNWMVTFKQFLAFPMFGFTVWLVWVLMQQVTYMAVFGVLLGFVLLGFAVWLLKVAPDYGRLRVASLSLAVISALAALCILPAISGGSEEAQIHRGAALSAGHEKPAFGRAFSPDALEQALAGEKPVFVEMTAAWCITCKFNHATSINIDSTKALFEQENVDYLVGDWTNYDPVITHYLESFERNGVPIYVFYGPPDAKTGERPKPVVLPQILTPGIVADIVSGR